MDERHQLPALSGDVTGDGKADVVGFGASYVYVSPSNGSGFGAQQLDQQ
jgi:hypothetical protein